mgnify:FL=1
MKLKELYDLAIKEDYIDLQALILFLVYEKQVLTLEDDSKELDLYFLDKHKERMNKELRIYKKKIGLKYGMQVYKFKRNDHEFMYVLAKSIEQAKFMMANYEYKEIRICDLDKEMSNGLTLKEIIKGKTPQILGGT